MHVGDWWVDGSGNRVTESRTYTVLPASDSVPPVLTPNCGSRKALVLPGWTYNLSYSVADDTGPAVAWLDLLQNGQLLQRLGPGVGNGAGFTYVVPSDAIPGATLSLRVVATDYGFNTAESALELIVGSGTVVTGTRTLLAGDTSLDGATVFVEGQLSVAGLHHFQNLSVRGGIVPDPTAAGRVEIAVDGVLDLQCGGTISVAGAGYAGAASSAEAGETYPGTRVGGVSSLFASL